MKTLQQIGEQTNTDKSRHSYKGMSYLNIYERHFEKRRESVKCFVEIGVLNGASLKMWEEYFPNATIYGIDIEPNCKQYESGRIKILIGDQNDNEFLKSVSEQIGEIDILLDDGSHITRHQINTFNHLYKNISKNGYYAIEDLRNSYEEFNEKYDLRQIWPGMGHNKPEDSLKNYREEFNVWIQDMVKKLDYHDTNFNLFGIYHYPMIVIFENK